MRDVDDLANFRMGPLPPPDPTATLERLRARLEERKMPAVRAKFLCNKIERTIGSRPKKNAEGRPVKDEYGYDKRETCEMWTIHMVPVSGTGNPDHENTKFWEASPGGSFQMNCVNPDAVKAFELGKEYYLDFTPAE